MPVTTTTLADAVDSLLKALQRRDVVVADIATAAVLGVFGAFEEEKGHHPCFKGGTGTNLRLRDVTTHQALPAPTTMSVLHTVLLIEAGGNGMSDPAVNTPLLFQLSTRTHKDWHNVKVPQPHTRHRRHYWPRGRLLGGCSSINAALYVRGAKADFDGWERDHGCKGWGWDRVKGYFAKIPADELDEVHRVTQELTRDFGFHGRSGPLAVSRSTENGVARTAEYFVEAAMNLGWGKRERYLRDVRGRIRGVDYNGEEQYGAAISQATVNQGVRCDIATAFIKPFVDPSKPTYRPNLTVVTDLLAHSVVSEPFPDATGKIRAGGVR
ncbi:hypothetical protein HDU96_002636, partial [Phlyctochytrium bullatum]